MKGLPYIVFSFLMLCALCSGMNSYRNTENRIAQDVNQALEQVLVKLPNQVITTDTIRCYRSYLTIAELKDTAGIALRTVRRNGRLETRLVAEANCSFASIFMMSDQRGSASLFMVGVLWLLGSWWYTRRNKPALVVPGLSYGGLVYHDDHFMTLSGDQIHLTAHAARPTRNVYDLRYAYPVEAGDLQSTMAQETGCQRHALHAHSTHQTDHRGP